jgi:uncharacterized protein (TIGR02246 family)
MSRALTPEDCDRLFAEGVHAGDLDAVAALYERDASFVTQEGEVVTGAPAIRGALAELVAAKPTLRMSVRRVVRAGGDLAVLYNDWSLTVTGRDGKPVESAGHAIEIVRRQADGSWLFVVDDPFSRR